MTIDCNWCGCTAFVMGDSCSVSVILCVCVGPSARCACLADSFFSDTAVAGEGHPAMSPGDGFDSGSPPVAYSMPEPTAYGGDGQFNTMSQVTSEATDSAVRMPRPARSSRSLLVGVYFL